MAYTRSNYWSSGKVLNPKELTAALLAKSRQWWDTDKFRDPNHVARAMHPRSGALHGYSWPSNARHFARRCHCFRASGARTWPIGARPSGGGDSLSTTIFQQGPEFVL